MNLKDKMKSVSPEQKPLEIKNEQNSSTSITQKSSQPSRELELLSKQSEALKNLTEERNKLLREGRPQDQEKIQMLSSEKLSLNDVISELRKDNQQKSEMIVSLNDRIEKLNRSDLVLKQNELLRQRNKELQESEQNTRREAEATVLSVKEAYSEKEEELDKKIAKAEWREREAFSLRSSLSAEIEIAASKKVENKIASLEEENKIGKREAQKEYENKKSRYQTLTFGSLIYGLFITILVAILNETFISECGAFFSTLFSGLTRFMNLSIEAGTFASQLGDMIPQGIAAFIIHWLLQIVVTVFIIGGIGYLFFILIRKFLEIFSEKFADEWSIAVGLIELAICVVFAEYLALLPINILLFCILVFVTYMVVRALIEWDDAEARKVFLMDVGTVIFVIVAIWLGLRLMGERLANPTK